jgi:hypothetical protein
MQRVLIITANCLILVFLLIGLPAATREQFGNLQFSSASTGRMLMFAGLGTATGANIFAVVFFIKQRRQKIVCWEWATVFFALLLAFYGFTRGYFNFEWLKRILLWLQNHL